MSGRCHGLEHPWQAKNKQQSTRAEPPGLRKEDKHKEPGLDHPGKREQAGSRAQSVGGRGRRRHKQDQHAAKKKDQERGTGRKER